MKRILAVFFAFSLLSSSIMFAQDDVRPDFANRRTALLFTFNGLANIGAGDFEGGIGGKMFFTPRLGVRAGLQFGVASETSPVDNGQDGKKSATGFGLNAALEYHLASTRVSPYIGGGLGFNTASTESKPQAAAGQFQETIKNRAGGENIGGQNYQAGTTFAFFGLAGVEFFLYKEISLAAEYQIGFMTTAEADEERITRFDTEKSKGGSNTKFGIENQGFITLAVYF